MFAQANSEHCRHKIFNADWIIDGVQQDRSLFGMVRETHRANPRGTVVAYSDNAAVMEGATVERFYPRGDGRYGAAPELTHTLMKVETHNHPTAIAPFPGAATGAGGEIRDEGATGIGAKPKAGLVGFTVSDLRIPGFMQPWESPAAPALDSPSPADGRGEMECGAGAPKHWIGKPDRIVSALHDHARGADRRRGVQQRVRPTQSRRLLPHVRAGGRGRGPRLPQADHDRGRRGQHPRASTRTSIRCRPARC